MINPSELIINGDGSVFHLHLRPDELADTVILVGDPGRSDMVAGYFDTTEASRANREFRSHTGTYRGKRLTVLATGIGCDNIDIVMTELDALANVDFATRTARSGHRELRIVRLGTSGAIQDDIQIGDYVMSAWSAGIDGLLNFYGGIDRISDPGIEEAFIRHTEWPRRLARPYFIGNDPGLAALFEDFAIRGMTATAPGFYGPQGRVVRLPLAQRDYLDRLVSFRHGGLRITNFEMESSAIAGLAALLGHRALTVCAIIAQRNAGEGNPDYKNIISKMVETALDKLTK